VKHGIAVVVKDHGKVAERTMRQSVGGGAYIAQFGKYATPFEHAQDRQRDKCARGR
jgi:hypothetical protein